MIPSTSIERSEPGREPRATDREPKRRWFARVRAKLAPRPETVSRVRFWVAVLLQVAVGGFAAFMIATYLYVALSRVAFPFDLEWMEGSVVDHVGRILTHGNVYGPPALEFTPFIYNPVYYYVSAAAALVTGLDYTPLRLVSIAGSLVCMGTIFSMVRRETGSTLCGLVGAGLFAATYKLSNAWFDVARVDSLAVGFCLGALYLVRFGEKSRTIAIAGVFAALMFGTKQSLLPIIPLCIVYLAVFESWRKALWFASTSVGISAASMIVLHVVSEGWYLRYTFLYPRSHDLGFITPREWQLETTGALIFAVAFAVFFLLGSADLKKKVFYGVIGASLVFIAYYSRAHSLSHVNVNIPAHAAIALVGGLGVAPFLTGPSYTALLAGVALLVQFEILRYPPQQFIPNANDYHAANKLADVIRSFDGEVYLPHHGFIAAREGKGAFAHDIGVFDVERAKAERQHTRERVRRQTAAAIRERRFAAIILDYDSQGNLPGLEANYRRVELDLGNPAALNTRVGLRVRPSLLYVRKRPRKAVLN